ncbi:hypothetical protein ACLO87_03630 [Paenalcaligenes sp. Me52]|uniref:hypothetical protein n=1 Tax=Paenalcaligenes sp. Me52 TaxID=3392038 RepID=UPI003D2C7B23
MKRSHIEQLKQRAKQFHQHQPLPLLQGLYNLQRLGRSTDAFTYEANAIFVQNDHRVYLHWEHPRLRYMRLVEELAWQQLQHQPTLEQELWIADNSANYRNLSLSSHQLLSWSPASHEARQAFYQELSQKIQEVGQDTDFHIRPELRSYWTTQGRVVELCCPIEVRNIQDLQALTTLAKQLLQGEQNVQSLYGDADYTQADWAREFTSPSSAATPIMPE